ncbi:Cas1p-domain-containing protein [Cylindrobasidium torrendii FP15055 ss-10]|uniref:Cas1p-domain-containing protein n=1 Tax=Cylindrobasidium torrendii FP15055 ss-10 TaxID=1314674 RepID=A0A0D7B055_9AGAR|nr:Cas1p-domain-containing protein [Cylindrobasidium torrendii FP15055 ss-10]
MARSNFQISPQWPNYAGLAALFLAVAIGVGRYFILDWWDPLHCQALLSEGTWADGNLKQWQPDGCMLHTYKPKEVASCAHNQDFVFVGDSVTRSLFFHFANLADAALPTAPPDDEQKHADHRLVASSGVRVSFYWDPFLNGTHTREFLAADTHRGNKRPALLVLGSGVWYLRHAEQSGGMSTWEATMEHLLNSLALGMSRARPADEVVLLPVQQVVPSKLSHDRAISILPSDIDAMNSDLYHRLHPGLAGYYTAIGGRAPPVFPVSFPSVFNDIIDPRETIDGLHYTSAIVKTQANVLLNLACNKHLPEHFPFDSTCCRPYPRPRIVHALLLLAVALWGPVSVFMAQPVGQRLRQLPTVQSEHIPRLVFSGSLLVIFFADRSNLWLKEHKHWNPWTFAFLCILTLVAGVATVKRGDKDLGFLNRDQTDEWKGWMQFAILIYHYLGASKISGIYNPIRVLVAAYLFMTGYGHATYYIKKGEFGFLRVAQILVRLNLLTVVLAYTMDTDYISYYFAPLVSMWYLIIYGTMGVLPQYNDRTAFLLAKVVVASAAVTWFMKTGWLLESLFDILNLVFKIQWSAREWDFRVELDMWIVWVGVLASIATIKVRELRITDHPQWPLAVRCSIGASAVVMIWYFGFELAQESKFTYNAWQPYVSFLPVLAFAVLRNASTILRSGSSRLFAFIGKCSLETFIIQYHFWLAGDTKGVLLVIPGTRWRPLNFVFTTLIFVFVSHWVAQATGEVTAWLCSDGKPKERQTMPPPATQQQPMEEIPMVTVNGEKPESPDAPPTTPTTPGRRWLDRLAAPEDAVSAEVPWVPGLKTKLGAMLGVMWMLNLLW